MHVSVADSFTVASDLAGFCNTFLLVYESLTILCHWSPYRYDSLVLFMSTNAYLLTVRTPLLTIYTTTDNIHHY